MQLKFIKKVDDTKHYSLRYITNAISLSVSHKPELEISLWFDYKGINYDHIEFTNLKELQQYVKKYLTRNMSIFFVSSHDGECTYSYIAREKQVPKTQCDVQKIEIMDYTNHPVQKSNFHYIGNDLWVYMSLGSQFYTVSKERPANPIKDTNKVVLSLKDNHTYFNLYIGHNFVTHHGELLALITQHLLKFSVTQKVT